MGSRSGLLVVEGGSGHATFAEGDLSYGLTVDEMRDALMRDGTERNLPWALAEGRHGVVPVGWLIPGGTAAGVAASFRGESSRGDVLMRLGAELSGPLELNGKEWRRTSIRRKDKGERHVRFIVSFPQQVEARRFVRAWHRREIDDGAVLNATLLW